MPARVDWLVAGLSIVGAVGTAATETAAVTAANVGGSAAG